MVNFINLKSDFAIVVEILEYNINIIQVRKSRIFYFGGVVAIVSNNELKLNLFKTETFASFEHATQMVGAFSQPGP